MKVRQISINQFGHFTDYQLALPSDGLQVIYGPNEAGKTTLLQFLRGWLFDFPARTPYAFQQGTEISGVGTLLMSDGRTVELRRRKGNRDKISVRIDGQETGLDDSGFQRLIGHANRGLFESVFAFGHEQLIQGEETLKHESLQSALFGGGLGTAASPEKILQALERDAGELFNPGAKKPTINHLLSELKTVAAGIREKTLRSDEFVKCRKKVETDEARATDLHTTVDRLRRDHARIEKLCRAIQKWRELQQLRLERAPLSVPPGLPHDARARYAALSSKLQDGDEALARLANKISHLERDLAAIRRDPESVSFRAEIRGCLELKQSYLEARTDLPKLKAEYDLARQEIERELRELMPGWTADDLRTFEIDVVTNDEIERLIKQARARQTAQVELRAKREQLSRQLRQARADLEELGPLRNVDPLVAVLADEASCSGDLKLLEKRRAEAAQIERQFTTRFKKLNPQPPTGATAIDELPVPGEATIKRFESEFADLRERVRATAGSQEQDENELRDVQQKLADLVAEGAVPSLSDRDEARERRDAAWTALRHRIIEKPKPKESELVELSDAFEAAVRDADAIADQIYKNADAVARREELGRQHQQLSERIARKADVVAQLRQEETSLQDRWVASWATCGFVPGTPEEMRAWASAHAAVCETVARRDEIRVEIEVLQSQIADFENRLRAVSDSPTDGIQVLIVAAQRAVDDAKQQNSRSRELNREIKRIEPQLAECDAELDAQGQSESTWRDAWQNVLTRLRLPAELSMELAQTVIGRLRATRVKIDGLPQDEQRLLAMQARLDEFAARVRPLCEALAPDFLRDLPELAIEKLSDQLERAAEAQKQFDQLQKQRQDAEDQRATSESRQVRLRDERSALFTAAEVSSEAEFFDVVERGERIALLDRDLEQRVREIDLIRAGDDRDQFEQLLNQEPELLEGQRRDLAEQLNAAEEQMRVADGAAGAARNELQRLDGSGEAAILTEQHSRKRAQLIAEVDRYVPLVFARHLLGEAVRRFERENQPEMVATVTRLFCQMTDGRYVEFDRSTAGQQGIRVRKPDGSERTPEQLSSGTREQLYLAIRLAYVLHYCRQNEPLPIVMDDVLVNFDDKRVRNTLATLAEIGADVQILFFTCHPHMVALARDVIPGLSPIELPVAATASPNATA